MMGAEMILRRCVQFYLYSVKSAQRTTFQRFNYSILVLGSVLIALLQ
jgi:hypothetical protein